MASRKAVLSLGSNLGNSVRTLDQAVRDLALVPGLRILAVSAVYRTEPVGGPEQPEYANVTVLAETDLEPHALLEGTMAIEQRFGRERGERFGPRTLDVDLIVVGDLVSDDERLTLPHPRAHERCFVLRPWLDVEPDAELPPFGRIDELLESVDCSGVRLWEDP